MRMRPIFSSALSVALGGLAAPLWLGLEPRVAFGTAAGAICTAVMIWLSSTDAEPVCQAGEDDESCGA